MPFWVWIFVAVCIAYGGVVLWRAWAKGFVKYGPIHYTRSDHPIYFWFFVALFSAAEIWFIGLAAVLLR